MARKKIRFLLLDLPDEDEVDGFLSSECEIVKSILSSRNLGGRIKHYRFSSLSSFTRPASHQYDPKFVHISGHGGENHISLIGGNMKWTDLAEEFLGPRLKELNDGDTRILFVSTCYSERGVDKIFSALPNYFTGAYYFSEEDVPFADALTTAAMFYRRKEINNPHERILKSINGYFGRNKRLFYKSAP